jgi:1,5-anhydro-D-fructose reductase (1,5-anhydro-D-mannitol-forming)
MQPLKFGILGTGDGARNHGMAFVSGVEGVTLYAVCGRDDERLREFADAYGAKASFTNMEAFLADPALEAVIVATPDALHSAHAIAAMRSGKHVLVEKPMTLSISQANDMACTARFREVRLGVGFYLRHHAGHRALRDAIAAGAVGAVSGVYLEWSTQSMGANNWRARASDGWWALAALGSHALDLASWLVGSTRAVSVFAAMGSSASGRDERVAVHLALENGISAFVRVSVADAPAKYVRISGSKGVVECHETLGGRGRGRIVLPGGERLAFEPVNPYVSQLADFVAAVREGRDPDAAAAAGILNVDWLGGAGGQIARA